MSLWTAKNRVWPPILRQRLAIAVFTVLTYLGAYLTIHIYAWLSGDISLVGGTWWARTPWRHEGLMTGYYPATITDLQQMSELLRGATGAYATHCFVGGFVDLPLAVITDTFLLPYDFVFHGLICDQCEWDDPRFYIVIPIGVCIVFVGLSFAVRMIVGKPERKGHCQCGYNLRGNVSGVCPECGTVIRSRRDFNMTAQASAAHSSPQGGTHMTAQGSALGLDGPQEPKP